MNFSRSGRPIIQAEQKNQVAADELARMAATRANRMRTKLQQEAPQFLSQLQGNPQLQQELLTAMPTKDDYDDLVALLGEMNMGSGSRGGKRRTKRRRTLKKRTLKRRRRY